MSRSVNYEPVVAKLSHEFIKLIYKGSSISLAIYSDTAMTNKCDRFTVKSGMH